MKPSQYINIVAAGIISVAACHGESPLSPPLLKADRSGSLLSPTTSAANTLLVDDDGMATASSCDAAGAASSTIGAAVAAAKAGDLIHVCPGVYEEQVVVTQNDLVIEGAGSEATVIRPTAPAANTTGLFTGSPLVPIVLVDGAIGVVVRHLTLDGSAATAAALPECPPLFLGIYYRNASGTVQETYITGLLHPSLLSCGVRIVVESGSGGSSNVVVDKSTVDQYGAVGIICNQMGTTCSVRGTTVKGRGPVDDFPQAGIQIAFGAFGADISGNTISDHVFTPRATQVNPFVFAPFGTGIVLGAADLAGDPDALRRLNQFASNEVDVFRIGTTEALQAFFRLF